MILPKLLRKKTLEALKMAEGYGKDETMLREMVEILTGEDPGRQAMRDALEPLHADDLIRSEKDEDQVVLWYITPKGSAKLNTL
jgi:ribosomal protein S28E/S33